MKWAIRAYMAIIALMAFSTAVVYSYDLHYGWKVAYTTMALFWLVMAVKEIKKLKNIQDKGDK